MPQLYWDSVVDGGIVYRKQPNGTLILTGVHEMHFNNVKIPMTVQGMDVVAIKSRAFARQNLLYSIELPESLTTVEDDAFIRCEKLKSVVFKADEVKLGNSVFCGCGKLQEVFGWEFLMDSHSVFDGCSRLATIDAYFQGEIKHNTFLKCKKLKELYFRDNISIRKNAFFGCMSLEKMFFESKVSVDDVMDFISKRTILCHSDCPLVELGYTGTNVVIRKQ